MLCGGELSPHVVDAEVRSPHGTADQLPTCPVTQGTADPQKLPGLRSKRNCVCYWVEAMSVIDFIRDNWEVLFAGVGTSVLIFVLSLILRSRSRSAVKMKQRSGRGSVNLQAGRDIALGCSTDVDDRSRSSGRDEVDTPAGSEDGG